MVNESGPNVSRTILLKLAANGLFVVMGCISHDLIGQHSESHVAGSSKVVGGVTSANKCSSPLFACSAALCGSVRFFLFFSYNAQIGEARNSEVDHYKTCEIVIQEFT